MPDLQKLSENSLSADSSRQGSFSLVPESLEEAWKLAQYMAQSDLVPKDYKGKPENVLVAVQMGLEIGLKPMQAMQNIAVINGRPSVWGDAALAICRDADTFDESAFREYFTGDYPSDGFAAVCEVKRTDKDEPRVQEFSVRDAKEAKLWNKKGPWQQYPKRMLRMRARSWALRDEFTDVLKGLYIREEARDIPSDDEPERSVQEAVVVEEGQEPTTRTDDVKDRLSRQQAKSKDEEDETEEQPQHVNATDPPEPEGYGEAVQGYRSSIDQCDNEQQVDEVFENAREEAAEWPAKYRDTLMENLDQAFALWQEREEAQGSMFDEEDED